MNLVEWSAERIDLIKNTYCKGGTDLDLQLFIATCERLKLSPEARQIYAVIRQTKNGPQMTIQVSIDGFRLVADRTDKYEGQTPVQWCDSDGIWREIWVKKSYPLAARVGVLKRGFKAPLYAVAHWDEYVQTNYSGQASQFWGKMPRLMLGKVAEALALRKAFPNELSGVYAPEEMGEQQLSTESKLVQGVGFSAEGSPRSGAVVYELAQTPAPITPPVEPPPKPSPQERIPKMLDAFKEHFALESSDLEAMLHKGMGDVGDEDIKTLEQIFKDLKNEKLGKEDLESIKEVLAEAESDG